jgi:hypothetical protein
MKEDDANFNLLLKIGNLNKDKILYKKMPSIIGISNKRLIKINP